MKWQQARIGDVRKRWAFLLLPLAVNGEVRWLCFARWSEQLYGTVLGSYWLPIAWWD